MNATSIEYYFDWFNVYFVKLGMASSTSVLLSTLTNSIIFIFFVILLDIITRKIIVHSFRIFSSKTKTSFDNFLVESNFPRFVAHIIPIVFILYVAPTIFKAYEFISQFLVNAADVYLIVLAVLHLQQPNSSV